MRRFIFTNQPALPANGRDADQWDIAAARCDILELSQRVRGHA